MPTPMRHGIAAALAAVLALGLAVRGQSPVLALVAVNVIPMDRERTLAGYTVVTQGDRIVAMGPNASVTVPANATRLDGAGKYLMPGLSEMHAHVPPGNAPDTAIARVLELFAVNGITTIRGMLGAPKHIEFRARAARGDILSPRIWTTGPSFSGNSWTARPCCGSACRPAR